MNPLTNILNISVLVSFHFSLKDSLWHYWNKSLWLHIFSAFVCLGMCLIINFEGEFGWVHYFWLAFIFFPHFDYIIPLPSVLPDRLLLRNLLIVLCGKGFSYTRWVIFLLQLSKFSLSLTFDNLIIMCLSIDFFKVLKFLPVCILQASWVWMSFSLPRIGKVTALFL